MECPNCGKDVDNLELHNSQFHDALEVYATERSKGEIQKEIDKLQKFINVASFENPLNMGDDKEKLSALQVEWANATEEYEPEKYDVPADKDIGVEDDEEENRGTGVVKDQGEIWQSDTINVEQEADEMEHQEDKPEMSPKEWEDELSGLKDEYATEEEELYPEKCAKCGSINHLTSEHTAENNAMPQGGTFDSATEEADDERKTCPECGADNSYYNQKCQNCLKPFSGEGETETSDGGTDVNTVMEPDVDDSDTDAVSTFSMESWDRTVTFNTKVQAFEGIGLGQGDALKLAELNWRELSIEVRGALNEFADDEKEEKREDIQDAFNDEGAGVGADQPDTTIEDLDEIDYNIIGDNPVAVEKYQCEHCNSGFKSNEALMIHYNDLHVPAREFMLDVPNTCTYCGQEIPSDVSMGEHLAYDHGISLDTKLDNGMVTDGYEGGQGSGPKPAYAPTPEGTGRRDIDPHYDPYAPDPDPIGDPSSVKLTEAEGGWDECQDCNFIGNSTEDTEKHKEETGHNTEHFGFKPAVAGNEVLKKKIISREAGTNPEETWNLLSNSEKEAKFGDWLADYSDDESSFAQYNYGNISYNELPQGFKNKLGEAWKPHIYQATEAVSYEEFKEDEHPREDSGKFTSGGSSDVGQFAGKSEKDLVKSIKGGSKDWHDWGRNENNEEVYAEIEKRNQEIPKPKRPEGAGGAIFRDDPNAVSKMEAKVKYLEGVQDYWKQITKFPARDYHTRPTQLGDAKWYELSNTGANLRDARKKLEGIKAQQERGTQLVRKPTYKDSKKRFYYSEEPKGESRATESSVVCPNCGSIRDKEHIEGEKFRCKDCGVTTDYSVDFDKDATGESKANEFQPERQGKRVKLLTGDYAGKTGTIGAVSIFGEDFHVRVDGVHNEYSDGVPMNPRDVEFLGGEGFVTEDDPDSEDPDYQGFVDGVKVEPSQFTQSGMDKEDADRGDTDDDALEAWAKEDDERWECLDCDQKFNDAGKHQDETGHHNITKYRGE